MAMAEDYDARVVLKTSQKRFPSSWPEPLHPRMVCPLFQFSLSRRQLMEDLHLNPSNPRGRTKRKAELRGVHVPPHRPHRSDSHQFVQHLLFVHISCMQDQLDARQQFLEAHVKETVRVRDYTDFYQPGLMVAARRVPRR